MTIAGLVVLAGQLLGPAIDDARMVPHLIESLDAHIAELPAPAVEEKLASVLLVLEHLDPEMALTRARAILKLPVGLELSLVAHRVAARAGDGDAVRSALESYGGDPNAWRQVLGDAAAANDDVRLADFLEFAALPEAPDEEVFRTTLLRLLGQAVPPSTPPLDLVRESSPGEMETSDVADGFAAMYRVSEIDPEAVLEWLDADDDALRERARRIIALSNDSSRLPLLIELAVTGHGSSRRAAFRALAEMELGDFDLRLHRLAGDADRDVRFDTALALVPSGDEWAFRLLFAEIDESSPIELRRARRSIERLARAEAIALLERLAFDGTATPFAVELYLEVTSSEIRLVDDAKLWALLAPHVEANVPNALLAAARLDLPEARAQVRRYLER